MGGENDPSLVSPANERPCSKELQESWAMVFKPSQEVTLDTKAFQTLTKIMKTNL